MSSSSDARVVAYVPDKHDRKAYKRESLAVRKFGGLSMVMDALRRDGIEVGWAGPANMTSGDIVLVSITSNNDWYAFVKERLRWPVQPRAVIVGGAGVMNVRPVLPWFDIAVFGRSEGVAAPLVRSLLAGERLSHDSVAYADDFGARDSYSIRQADACYPQEYPLQNGKPHRERLIGCPKKCLFCCYTWHRKHVGDKDFGDGFPVGSSHRERTIFDLLKQPPETWMEAGNLLVGLDGFSERLRRRAGKPITREMWREFLVGLSSTEKAGKLRVFNIVGFPTETREDWHELLEDIRWADERAKPGDVFFVDFQCTPFKAYPATPCAAWAMPTENFRGAVRQELGPPRGHPYRFFEGRRFVFCETFSTEHLAGLVLEALMLRGTEASQDLVRKLCATPRFWSASRDKQLRTLEGLLDIEALMGEGGDGAAAYLQGHTSEEDMKRKAIKWRATSDRSARV